MKLERRHLTSAVTGLLAVAASVAATAGNPHAQQLAAPALVVDRQIGHFGAAHTAALQHTVARATSARRALSWHGGPTTAGSGETVNVFVSDRYAPEQNSPQVWADFLAALPHGSELSAITAYIAPLDELEEICGEQALGCYGSNQLFSAGDTIDAVTPQEIVRHEFGHHIAANRLNPPWKAVDWGPKAWATDQGVCTRAANGTAYPGDEGDNYELNPGEAWAESYRVFAEQRAGLAPAPWEIVDPSFQPDAEALTAVERDVLQPWSTPTTKVFKRRYTLNTPKGWLIQLTTPADGDVAITVTLPKGGYHTVVLLGQDGKTVVGRGLWAGTTVQRVTTTLCGQRAATLRITRRGSIGRVSVVVTTP